MKTIKWIGLVLVALFLLGYFVGLPYLREQTKKQSPEKTAVFQEGGLDLQVSYCSPSKKGREIFGGLVPYGKVWRTGANEPTTLSTTTDLMLGGQILPAGKYSLWTIPGPEQWTIIFNSEIPDWGVTLSSMGRKTTRNPETDALQIIVPVNKGSEIQEHFQIDFRNAQDLLYLRLVWDDTQILVPLNS